MEMFEGVRECVGAMGDRLCRGAQQTSNFCFVEKETVYLFLQI